MTGTKGNSEFCFPETLIVSRGEAKGIFHIRLRVLRLSSSLVLETKYLYARFSFSY